MSGLLRASVFFVVLALILFAGLRPPAAPLAHETADLVLHVLAFALLVCSARLAFPLTHPFWTVLYSLIFALMIELLQGLMPQGAFSLAAVAANMLGVFVGLAVARFIQQWLEKRQASNGW